MDAYLLGRILPFVLIFVICLALFIGGIWGLVYQLDYLSQKNITYGALLEVNCYSQDMAFYNTTPILMEIFWNIIHEANVTIKSNYSQIVMPHMNQHCWVSQCLWNNSKLECSMDFNGFNPYYVYLNQTYNPENYQSDYNKTTGLASVGIISAFIIMIMAIFFIVQRVRAEKKIPKIMDVRTDGEN
jgi:hypothetical protein